MISRHVDTKTAHLFKTYAVLVAPIVQPRLDDCGSSTIEDRLQYRDLPTSNQIKRTDIALEISAQLR